jgi:hypothetical protein
MSDIIEIDVTTGEVTEREYTQEEISYKAYLESQITFPEVIEPEVDPNKQSAIIKLQSLGLTADEARAIVGI